MLISRLLTAALLACSVACAGTPPAAKLDGEDLDLRGRMDLSMLEPLRTRQWSKVRAIRFSSSGGLTQYSVQIARILSRSGKLIIIHDMCSSACLDVLVIRRARIEPGTLVLLHNTPAGQALTTRDYLSISAFLTAIGEQESRWLIENGVDPRLTLFSDAATEPVCVFAPADTALAASQLLTIQHFDAWAPRDTTLAALGVTAARSWRQDTASVLRTMRTSYPKANLARLRPANEPAIPGADAIRRVLTSVRICKRSPL